MAAQTSPSNKTDAQAPPTAIASSPQSPSMNYSNIPTAPFAENAQNLITAGQGPQGTLEAFQSLLQKYLLMEKSLVNKKKSMEGSIREIQQSMVAIEQLLESGDAPIDHRFGLGEGLYAHATINAPATAKVNLWLGADLMVEYECGEALSFLQGKLEGRQEEVARVGHDIDFLKHQITTMEVNIARIYNLSTLKQ